MYKKAPAKLLFCLSYSAVFFLSFSLPSPSSSSSLLELPNRHAKETSWYSRRNLQTSLVLSNLSSFLFPLTFYIILFFIPAEGSTHIKVHLHGEFSSMLRCHWESCSTHCALHRDARSPCWISESFTDVGEGWRTVHQKNTGHGDGWGTLQLPWSRIRFEKWLKERWWWEGTDEGLLFWSFPKTQFHYTARTFYVTLLFSLVSSLPQNLTLKV